MYIESNHLVEMRKLRSFSNMLSLNEASEIQLSARLNMLFSQSEICRFTDRIACSRSSEIRFLSAEEALVAA